VGLSIFDPVENVMVDSSACGAAQGISHSPFFQRRKGAFPLGGAQQAVGAASRKLETSCAGWRMMFPIELIPLVAGPIGETIFFSPPNRATLSLPLYPFSRLLTCYV
jgi:hypothetical protein